MRAQLAVLRQLIESVLHDPLQMTIQTLREDLPTGLPDAGWTTSLATRTPSR